MAVRRQTSYDINDKLRKVPLDIEEFKALHSDVKEYFFSTSQKLFLQSPKILRTFTLASPTCISAGGQLHIERRYLRFVF